MFFDFDAPIAREQTSCEKYDHRLAKFGRADVIPLWVADMDFAAPPCVQEALQKRLAHPVFGYSFAPDSLFQALTAWFARRHQWQIDPAHLLLTAGVVPSLFAAVQALTEEGAGVIVPTPVYPPFFSAVTQSGRQLIECPLRAPSEQQHAATYCWDFELLEQQAKRAQLLLLCSPHNPVGRVWQKTELEKIIAIALRHNLVVVSDDIHCDLVLPVSGNDKPKHIPLATLAPKELRLISCISPSKSFNIPGLNLSALVASHDSDKRKIQQLFARLHVNPFNPLSLTAFEAAYANGESWLEALLSYLSGNQAWVLNELASTSIRCTPAQATALMWLDCRALGMTSAQLSHFFVNQAGLGLNDGVSFGDNGAGFMRLNIGTQRAKLQQAMQQLREALCG